MSDGKFGTSKECNSLLRTPRVTLICGGGGGVERNVTVHYPWCDKKISKQQNSGAIVMRRAKKHNRRVHAVVVLVKMVGVPWEALEYKIWGVRGAFHTF
jgi:hypothetical protein